MSLYVDKRVGCMIAVSQTWTDFVNCLNSKLLCLKIITGSLFFNLAFIGFVNNSGSLEDLEL